MADRKELPTSSSVPLSLDISSVPLYCHSAPRVGISIKKNRSRSSSSSSYENFPLAAKKARLTEIQLLLREERSFLSRCIVRAAIDATVQDEKPLKRDFIALIAKLHASFDGLFFSAFSEELDTIQNLAEVMRERTVSVGLLQFYWEPHNSSLRRTLSPVFHLGNQLTKKKIDLLMKPTPEGDSPAKYFLLKEKLVSCIKRLFQVDNFPVSICELCSRCIQMIKTNEKVVFDDKSTSIENWTVSSFIFLRSVIPCVTERGSEGHVFLGRLLMKLCCRSFFPNDRSSLANEILKETFPLFDKFCRKVEKIGEESLFSFQATPSFDDSRDPTWKSDLNGFVTDYQHLIINQFSRSGDISFVLKWKENLRSMTQMLGRRHPEMVYTSKPSNLPIKRNWSIGSPQPSYLSSPQTKSTLSPLSSQSTSVGPSLDSSPSSSTFQSSSSGFTSSSSIYSFTESWTSSSPICSPTTSWRTSNRSDLDQYSEP